MNEDLNNLKQQLQNLKKEQNEAEKIYNKRIQLGELNTNPANVQTLAQAILDRKTQIENLESQIDEINKNHQGRVKKDTQANQENSMVEYKKNPIVSWFQRVGMKMQELSTKLKDYLNATIKVDAPKTYEPKYQNMVDMDFSSPTNNEESKRNSFKLPKDEFEKIEEQQIELSKKYANADKTTQSKGLIKGR